MILNIGMIAHSNDISFTVFVRILSDMHDHRALIEFYTLRMTFSSLV